MKLIKNIKLLNLLLLLSVLLNVTIISTFVYKKYMREKLRTHFSHKNEFSSGHMMCFYRDELKLTTKQFTVFKEKRFEYMDSAKIIQESMHSVRTQIYNEALKENSNQNIIVEKSEELGKYHAKLKVLTIIYFKEMMNICNKTQQEKLKNIFLSMQNSETEITCKMNRNSKNK